MEAWTSNSDLHSHKYWPKMQTLDPDLFLFLEPDLDFTERRVTKERLQDIMKHFKVDPKLRPNGSKKDFLVAAYKTNLELDLQPFIKPKDPELEQKKQHKKKLAAHLTPSAATIEELRSAIMTRIRAAMVAPAFSKRALIRLWNHVFNRPQESCPEFSRRPFLFTTNELANKHRDAIRHALQCEHPEVFIPLPACTEPILRALYEKFVLENEALDAELCEGVHYCIIPKDSDHGSDSVMKNSPTIPK